MNDLLDPTIMDAMNTQLSITNNGLQITDRLADSLFNIFKKSNQNISKEEFIKDITPLINVANTIERTNIFEIRQGLINNLEQQKIINPTDKHGLNKMNFTLILEHLWLYGDKEKPLFDHYSELNNISGSEYDNIKSEFKKEYIAFFTDKFIKYLKNGVEAFNHNDKFFEYKLTDYGDCFTNLFKEALRIILTPEYLDCIGDGIEQRDEFKKTTLKVMNFFDV